MRLTYPDVALAEDLVQTAMIRGYQMMLDGRFEPTAGSLSWFIRGISCDFLAHRRKDKRSDVLPLESNVFALAEDPSTPATILDGLTLSEEITSALDQLPADQRACLELVDLAECSYQEAARILNVPVGTIRSRLSRARLFLCGHITKSKESK